MIDFLTSLIVLGFTIALFLGAAYVAFRILVAIGGWIADSFLPVLVGALILGIAGITVCGIAGAILG